MKHHQNSSFLGVVGRLRKNWLHVSQNSGISSTEQASWGNGDEGFRAWRKIIETAGILVFQTSEVERSEARGFAVPHEILPIIAVNNADFPNAKTFSLAHELMHLALRKSALTDFRSTNADTERPPEARAIEVFCNAAAAALLMPERAFLNHPVIIAHRRAKASTWDDESLSSIGSDFNVSQEATLRRLLTLGLTTEAFYREGEMNSLREPKRQSMLRKKSNVPKLKKVGLNLLE